MNIHMSIFIPTLGFTAYVKHFNVMHCQLTANNHHIHNGNGKSQQTSTSLNEFRDHSY